MTSPGGTLGPLVIERVPDGDRLVISLRGELDLASAPALASELYDAASDGFDQLVVDLSGLDFMDSTGLSVLLEAQRAADTDHHGFSLRRGPAQVQRVFEVTGLVDRLPFED